MEVWSSPLHFQAPNHAQLPCTSPRNQLRYEHALCNLKWKWGPDAMNGALQWLTAITGSLTGCLLFISADTILRCALLTPWQQAGYETVGEERLDSELITIRVKQRLSRFLKRWGPVCLSELSGNFGVNHTNFFQLLLILFFPLLNWVKQVPTSICRYSIQTIIQPSSDDSDFWFCLRVNAMNNEPSGLQEDRWGGPV